MKNDTWNARKEAVEILTEILKDNGYAAVVLDRRIQQYPPFVGSKDKALVTNLVYTTLTHLRSIDHILDAYSNTPVRKMKPLVASVLRIAVCQMVYMDRIPNRAAINEAVDLIKHSGKKALSGFVNGVLRAVDRASIDPMALPKLPKGSAKAAAITYSLPDFLTELWEQSYGTETMQYLAAVSSEKRPVSVRTNTLKVTPEVLFEELKEEFGADAVRQSEVMPWVFYLAHADGLAERSSLKNGHMTVQDESSVLAALMVQAAPGMRILDLCAAPGGKSTCMAQTMEDRGEIVSCDIYEHKLQKIRENAKRLGISIIRPALRDGTIGVPEEYGTYDAVLLDAPCSGFGILRQKPDIRWNREAEDAASLVSIQRKLLCEAARYVRPGGRLVYSTCTLNPQENEENVAWFLKENRDFTPGNPQKDLPILAMCDTIKNDTIVGCCTILPTPGGRDGFFISVFQKGTEHA